MQRHRGHLTSDAPASPPTFQRLTFRLGLVLSAVFARDGETILYSAAWGGQNSEVFSTRTSSRESRALGITDAKMLAVSSTDEMALLLRPKRVTWEVDQGTLARAPVGGGAPREVAEDVLAADWSPDGKDLAIVQVVEDQVQLQFPPGRVLYAPEAPRWISSVRISPRGVRIAFAEHAVTLDIAERLTIYASLAAASLDRARATEELGKAAARDAATLEAIRDGIVTFDEDGAIRSMNRAAARLLRIAREDAIGRSLADYPPLAPLAATLTWSNVAEPRSADGEVVALPHGDLLVRARPFEGRVVATVQDLQSAQRIAQWLVGNPARFTFAALVGRDSGFRASIEAAQRAARTDVAILVTGESGTGKERIARALHARSARASRAFVALN